MKFLKSGKVKDVYAVDELEFVFSDRVSVFDKVIPSSIPYKGETLGRTSAYWFGVAQELGYNTHFISYTLPNRMRVKRVDVIHDPNQITQETTNYLIPLECITRFYLYGSLWSRVKEGTVTPQQIGFTEGHIAKEGEPLPNPFFEVTTKLEKVDRPLTIEEGVQMAGMKQEEFNQMRKIALDVNSEINRRVAQRWLVHVDGKMEFAFDENRKLMIVDTFGTADEDRFWDATELAKGRFVERSKEFVRQYYRGTGYYDQLSKARKQGKEEPPIPALPDEMVSSVTDIYIQLFESMTGEKFRGE